MNLGDKIRMLLKEQGHAQQDLAFATGLAQQAISRIVVGRKRPNINTALRIANALGVTLDFLVDDTIDGLSESRDSRSEAEQFLDEIIRVIGVQEAKRRLLLAPEMITQAVEVPKGAPTINARGPRISQVYFIEDRSNRLIKIGFTKSLNARLGKIRKKHPEAYILATMRGDRWEESEVHEIFSRYRIDGEWFAPSPLIHEYMAANATAYAGRN
jgi:transcriptional regulator with XRE-family HTH domain